MTDQEFSVRIEAKSILGKPWVELLTISAATMKDALVIAAKYVEGNMADEAHSNMMEISVVNIKDYECLPK